MLFFFHQTARRIDCMPTFAINQNNFKQSVLEASQPILVDFWASWCGPCQMLAPVLEEFSQKHPEILVGKINIDEQPELAQQFNVMTIPTLILFRGGKPVATSIGFQSISEIEAMLS
jgi:thioredoxin 1